MRKSIIIILVFIFALNIFSDFMSAFADEESISAVSVIASEEAQTPTSAQELIPVCFFIALFVFQMLIKEFQ